MLCSHTWIPAPEGRFWSFASLEDADTYGCYAAIRGFQLQKEDSGVSRLWRTQTRMDAMQPYVDSSSRRKILDDI